MPNPAPGTNPSPNPDSQKYDAALAAFEGITNRINPHSEHFTVWQVLTGSRDSRPSENERRLAFLGKYGDFVEITGAFFNLTQVSAAANPGAIPLFIGEMRKTVGRLYLEAQSICNFKLDAEREVLSRIEELCLKLEKIEFGPLADDHTPSIHQPHFLIALKEGGTPSRTQVRQVEQAIAVFPGFGLLMQSRVSEGVWEARPDEKGCLGAGINQVKVSPENVAAGLAGIESAGFKVVAANFTPFSAVQAAGEAPAAHLLWVDRTPQMIAVEGGSLSFSLTAAGTDRIRIDFGSGEGAQLLAATTVSRSKLHDELRQALLATGAAVDQEAIVQIVEAAGKLREQPQP